MADLIVTGVSDYLTGGIDSATVLVSNVSPISARHPNGLASAVVQIETVLGSGTSLKGSTADLAARLSVALNATGTILLNGFTGLTTDRGLTALSATQLQVMNHTPIGLVQAFAGSTQPVNWLLCDGQAVSRTTYAKLFAEVANYSTATVTITIASPGVVSWSSHGLSNDQPVMFTTSGALPTGLSTLIQYYVKEATGSTFKVSATPGGSNINTSGTQSGVHTGYHARYGLGDGTTTFNVPDIRGRIVIMVDGAAGRVTAASTNGANADTLGGVGGAETHTLTASESGLPAHVHNITTSGSGGSAGIRDSVGGALVASTLGATITGAITSTGGGSGGAHSNTQPWLALNYIIFAGV